MERLKDSATFPIGSKLPNFELLNVDGRKVKSVDFASNKLTLIVFGCNHCPYVIGSEKSLIEIIKKYQSQGLVAAMINANDAKQYPEDSFAAMQQKAKSVDLPYLYLHDESQQVARMFDAVCTPECYLFDSNQKLIYHGAINNSHRDPSKVTESHLEKALQETLQAKPISRPYTGSIGCSIKWEG